MMDISPQEDAMSTAIDKKKHDFDGRMEAYALDGDWNKGWFFVLRFFRDPSPENLTTSDGTSYERMEGGKDVNIGQHVLPADIFQ